MNRISSKVLEFQTFTQMFQLWSTSQGAGCSPFWWSELLRFGVQIDLPVTILYTAFAFKRQQLCFTDTGSRLCSPVWLHLSWCEFVVGYCFSHETQSCSQSFVPLDQRSENESSGSIHFQITMEITEFCIFGFTAQPHSLHLWYIWRMREMDAPRALVFRPLVKGNEALGTRLV